VGNPWLFTGRQLDEEAALYFYRARYYDSGKGRFLQRDTVWGYVDGANLYEYVRSNPLRFLDPYGLTAEEIQSAYDKLSVLCDSKCLDRCKCTAKACKEEAATIAKAYVNRFHAVKKPYVPDRGDIHAGWMCYQWAGLIQRELGKLKLNCWTINWVGIVSGGGTLEHNYVFVSLGNPKDKSGPIRDCGKVLDPWKNKAPDVFDDTWAWHKWNYIHDPSTNEGDVYAGGTWQHRKYPPPWAPSDPDHKGAKNPDGSAYTPPPPVSDWQPKAPGK
jgi:RHS repeat-associated protein